DAGQDSAVTRHLLDELGFDGHIARNGVPAPVQAGGGWVIERTHAWMNGYGQLRRRTERNPSNVDFYPLPPRLAHHHPPAHPASPQRLPLGPPADHQAPQVTPQLPGALSLNVGNSPPRRRSRVFA